MTWTAFHRRGEVLRNVVETADQRLDGELPLYVDGVAETFADANDLLGALQLRWHTRLAGRIERTFRFKNFAQAFAFVQRVADLAEAEGHHPDICFGWGYATVSLQTQKIKGLHENDFIMAAKLDRMADAAESAGPT